MARYAPMLLLGVFLADRFLKTGIISSILQYPLILIAHLFAGDNLFRLMRVL